MAWLSEAWRSIKDEKNRKTLASFFKILEKRKVAPEDLDSTLREFVRSGAINSSRRTSKGLRLRGPRGGGAQRAGARGLGSGRF